MDTIDQSFSPLRLVTRLLNDIDPLPHIHLLGPRPQEDYKNPNKGQGVAGRNVGIQWLIQHYSGTQQPGVVYFADDDNTYDHRLFAELKKTRVVSVFPVGSIASFGLSTPIVNMTSGKITGFHDPWIGGRKFPLDTAGFAVDLQYLIAHPKANFPSSIGYEEDGFLKSLQFQVDQINPIAQNCTQLFVWHTKSVLASEANTTNMQTVSGYEQSNLPSIYDKLTLK